MPRGVGLNRSKVIDLAAEIADEKGLDALNLTELARRCGVRKPSLYKHVDGLPDLHSALAARAYLAVQAAMQDAKDTAELAHRWRKWALDHPGTYMAATPTHLKLTAEGRQAGAQVMSAVLRHLEKEGLCSGQPLQAARALRSLVHGFVVLEIVGGFGVNSDVDSSFSLAIEALIGGLSQA